MTENSNLDLHLFKSKELTLPSTEVLRLLTKFTDFAAKKLKIEGNPIKIRLLHAAPKEPLTTGAYEPATKKISVIVQNRHPLDWFRTIAHELVHYKQDLNGELKGPIPEIGGKIEDDANLWSGRICKEFIRDQLTDKDRKSLGLGTYGSR
jgi:hypothetical protein